MDEDVLVRYEELSFSGTRTVEITHGGEITVRKNSYQGTQTGFDMERQRSDVYEGEIPEEEVNDLSLLLEQVSEDESTDLSFFGELLAGFRYGMETRLDTPYTDSSVKWYGEAEGVLEHAEEEIARMADEYVEQSLQVSVR